MDETGTGSYAQFSVHIEADPQDAYDTIQDFETALQEKALELGDKDMFDDVLDISSESLNRAKDTIDKYGEQFHQGLISEITSNDNYGSGEKSNAQVWKGIGSLTFQKHGK